MILKNFLEKLEQTFCSYLKLGAAELRANSIQMKDDQLLITNTVSFKRHHTTESWDKFSALGIKQISSIDREKLGLAAGKAIAKKLVISFENPPIKNP